MDSGWTLADLVARAERALMAADVRAPNGRITEVPDARMIRWYTTSGLLDRPVLRGRIARYGPRHLLQLVSVKRLQGRGLRLAEIQQRLAGATDATLRRIADLPTEPDPGASAPGAPAEPDSRFWARRAAADTVTAPTIGNDRDSVGMWYGVELGGATLLLTAPPGTEDLREIRAVARPLVDALAARGLLRTRPDLPPSSENST